MHPTIAVAPVAHPAPVGRAAAPAAAGILAELTAGLAAGDDLHELLGRFLQPIVQIAGARAGAVRVLDSAGRRMRLVGDLGLPAEVLAAESSVEDDCGVCGAAVAGDRPVWTSDLRPCMRRSEGRLSGCGLQRVLAVPLHHRGSVLGVLNLFFAGGDEPPPEVLALLKSIGDLIGLALVNARLEREQARATLLAERQAMAADLHDSIGQSLAFAKMRLPLLHDAIHAGDRPGTERYFADLRSAIGQAHASLRGILTHFRAPIDPLGLNHALLDRADAFRRHTGVPLDVVDEAGALHLSPEQQAQAFLVVQEALTNIARHAGARHAWLRLSERPGSALQIVVEDDGAGIAPATAADAAADSTHYGLAIMRERARRLGGTLSVGPRAGGGTLVQLEFPLRGDARKAC